MYRPRLSVIGHLQYFIKFLLTQQLINMQDILAESGNNKKVAYLLLFSTFVNCDMLTLNKMRSSVKNCI